MSDTSPTYRPVIVLPSPGPADFQPRGGGSAKTNKPSRDRQGQRLDGKFDELERLLSGSSDATVTAGVPDNDPELAVVFEVVESTTDLAEAFRSIGLEPLLDIEGDIDDESLGDDFTRLKVAGADSEPIKRFLHASMANEAAVAQLLRLWRHWKSGQRMLTGFGAFTSLFKNLHDVRPWGPIDRVRSTGLADLITESFADGLAEVPLNVELWFRASPERRRAAEQAVRSIVAAAGGEVLADAERVEIGYHALAATVPTLAFVDESSPDLAAVDQIALIRTPEVLFIRPGGQRVGALLDDDLPASPEVPASTAPTNSGPPLLAIIDGLPASNHPRLRDRLEIVDPDDFGAEPAYTVDRRRHGTMVASAVVWGDLGAEERPTTRKVVVRPVLKPDLQTQQAEETVPWTELPADLTIRATRDILGSVGLPGVGSGVRVINVSLGDPLAQFDTVPSAWARAIDWLAYEHRLLFVVSAGNHPSKIQLSADELKKVEGADRDRMTSDAIAALSPQRRLLSPAEALNAVTVGALHADASGDGHPMGYLVDLWGTEGHPSPTTAHGRGIRRAIKPDLAAPGGRQLFDDLRGAASGWVSPAHGTASPPGVQVAAPPDRVAYVSGTTFAAAEVARRAARIIESLQATDPVVQDGHLAVAAKALLVHGTAFPDNPQYGVAADRLLGHGALHRDLAEGCPPSQATVLFTGELAARQMVELVLPFPSAVAGMTGVRRISTTLAWLSPINWNHRQYRRAKVTIDGPREIESKNRAGSGPAYGLTRRGTVEHRSFATDRAFAADQLTFTVKCTDQAGGFSGTVPFAVAVSLEIGLDVNLDVYELVRDVLRARARVR
jgi:hypothetical protein